MTTMNMTEAECEAMLARAAEEGARRALSAAGLADDEAGDDVRFLRSWAAAWRSAGKAAIGAVVGTITKALMWIIVAGLIVTLGPQMAKFIPPH